MFFFLSKVIGVLLLPMPLLILFGLLWVVKIGRGFHQKLLLVFPFLLLYTISSFWISQWVIQSLEKDFPGIPLQLAPKSDFIVVLGGSLNTVMRDPNRIELNESADRLIDAFRLYRIGKAPKILFTGGSGILTFQETKEADYAKQLFLDLGVRPEDLVLESESRNTFENAIYTKQIIGEDKSILLVTSALHMKRSLAIFEKAGFREVNPFPTDYRTYRDDLGFWDKCLPSPGHLQQASHGVREWIGIWAYRFQGYL